MSAPSTTNPTISKNEVFPPSIAAALWVLVTSLIADLTALWNAVFNGASGQNVARCVLTSLGAYTGTGTGVLTVTATGALAAQDGVTVAAGDIVFLPKGLTNISATADAGFYSVTSAGGSGVHAVLTRVPWWATGATIAAAATVKISEGTIWAGTTWRSFAVKGSAVVDTNDPLLFFEQVVVQATLLTGSASAVLAGYPLRSATKSQAIATYVSGAAKSTTVGYGQGVITPGDVGTGGSATQASVTISALIAGMTAAGSGDVSVVNVLLTNP